MASTDCKDTCIRNTVELKIRPLSSIYELIITNFIYNGEFCELHCILLATEHSTYLDNFNGDRNANEKKSLVDGKPRDLLLQEQANQQVEMLHIITIKLTDGGQHFLICGQVVPLPDRRHEHPPSA